MWPREVRCSRAVRLFVSALAVLLPAVADAQPSTIRVNLGPGGAQANSHGFGVAISGDGRWVAFDSTATNLVTGDTNDAMDVFVHDLQNGTTSRVSVGTGGIQGNSDSNSPAISADGRFVAFSSRASNLVVGDTNGEADIFVHDLQTAATVRVSVGLGGAEGNSYSYSPAISADGRWIGFGSNAGNLVANDTNGAFDVFVHDRQTATTTRVSIGTSGEQGFASSRLQALDAEGRRVVFDSFADTLVPGDSNRKLDVFVHDRQTGTTTRVSVGHLGAQGNGDSGSAAISADGRWVTFSSDATNLVPGDTNGRKDAFVHDLFTGATTRASVGLLGVQADGDTFSTAISADGRWVSFDSLATNLVAEDSNGVLDVFVYDRQTAATTRVSVGPGGAQADTGGSDSPVISAEGRRLAFVSRASDLVGSDTNERFDVFVHDRVEPQCTVAFAPSSAWAPAAGASASLTVTAPAACTWTAVSNDPGWLTVTGVVSGTGSATVAYATGGNPGSPRTGSLTVWGQMFQVHQASATIPESPKALVVESVAGNLVTLRWIVPPGGPAPTGFLIEGGVNEGEVLASLPTGGTAPRVTFAAPAGSFYVRVHAVNGVFRSAASNEVELHVNTRQLPSAPANLLGLVNGSSLALAWTTTYQSGAPTRLWLGVSGPISTWVPLGLTDSFSFNGVPAGTYTLWLVAQNLFGDSIPSNDVTLTFPGACTGPPELPARIAAYRVGRTVFVDWAPATFGPAPTSYVLHVTGSFAGSFATSGRALSGTVAPGSYTLRVAATNACGESASTAPQTVVVP